MLTALPTASQRSIYSGSARRDCRHSAYPSTPTWRTPTPLKSKNIAWSIILKKLQQSVLLAHQARLCRPPKGHSTTQTLILTPSTTTHLPPTYDEAIIAYANLSGPDAPAHSQLVEQKRVQPHDPTPGQGYDASSSYSSSSMPSAAPRDVAVTPLTPPSAAQRVNATPSWPPACMRDVGAAPLSMPSATTRNVGVASRAMSFPTPCVQTMPTAPTVARSCSQKSTASSLGPYAPPQGPPPSSPSSVYSSQSSVYPLVQSSMGAGPFGHSSNSTPTLGAKVMCPDTPGSLMNGLKNLMMSGSAAQLLNPPPHSFNRPPPQGLPYAPFPPCALMSLSRRLDDGFPAIAPHTAAPHPFATHDVSQEDWVTFLSHVRQAGSLPSTDMSAFVTRVAPRALGLNYAAGTSHFVLS